MQVKFLQDVHSAIGIFVAGDVHSIEDEHVRKNWIANGLIELVEDKPKRGAK
jgi:hypothetical protein